MSLLYSKILIVDDEVEVCEALKEFFEDQQFIIAIAHDGEDALSKVDEFKPHCILLDIKMPYLNGIEALGMIEIKDKEVEVIMVTAVSNIKIAEECMRKGAFGYVTKPVDLDHLLKEVKGALEHRKKKLGEQKQKKEELDHLKEESLKFQKLNKTLNQELYLALKFPFKLIKLSHPEFGCHSHNVAWLAKEIAEHMKLKFVWRTALGSYYHDVGKLNLPRDMWGGISDEWDGIKKKIFKSIPIWGQEIVQSHPELGMLGEIIRHQCENVDGSGYPDGISGDEIPIESRIIAVANAFDEILEMGNRRNIQQDICEGGKVLEVIKKDVNKKYDASVVQAVAEIIELLKYKSTREKKVALNELAPNMVLSRDLISQSGKLILSRNTTLNPTLINKAILLEKIDPFVSDFYVFASSETNKPS
ncbi:MAG: response regulator [Nitrospinae bacterium]|nr:response regulator [Nitrospinota bacterium]MBL7020319.1 response regulator [Nitrospinaceae bacterium]